MTDYFALLNELRRPWIDSESLKAKFRAVSADIHPDRVHAKPENQKREAQNIYTELNAAYRCLSDRKERLFHLLCLELGSKPPDVQGIPPEVMQMFFEVGKLCQGMDTLLQEKAKQTSPLLQVQFFERSQPVIERAQATIATLNQSLIKLDEELRSLNSVWETAPSLDDPSRRTSLPLDRLQNIYRRVSYYSRWLGQLQERVIQLSL